MLRWGGVFATRVRSQITSSAIGTELLLTVINHVTWFTGVEAIQYCNNEREQTTSHYTETGNMQALPDWRSGCLFQDAAVATLKRPDNLPFQEATAHFLADIDFRQE